MNDSNSFPPNNNPELPEGWAAKNPTPPPIPTPEKKPEADAPDQTPIVGIVSAIDALLRQPRRIVLQLRRVHPGGLIAALLFIALGCSLAYGLVAGTFSGGTQLWAAPFKVAAGVLTSGLICLPSLYIFSCLSGSPARLLEVSGMTAGLLALMTVLLIGFAPVAWVFSQSTQSIAIMGGLHLLFWVVAAYFGLRFLHSGLSRPYAAGDSGLQVWTVIFVLVALQMTTALRPIIGTSDTLLPAAKEKKFFVSHWLDCIHDQAVGSGQK